MHFIIDCFQNWRTDVQGCAKMYNVQEAGKGSKTVVTLFTQF